MFGIKWPWEKHLPAGITSGGADARKRAEQELSRVRSETPYYEGLGRDLRKIREVNHIAERLRATMRGV